MEQKVTQLVDSESDHVALQIQAMGWQDDFAAERISVFTQKDREWSGWGHRIPSDWAEGWLRGWFDEYNYHVMERLDLLPPQHYSADGTPVF
jgi:hypothetical protein